MEETLNKKQILGVFEKVTGKKFEPHHRPSAAAVDGTVSLSDIKDLAQKVFPGKGGGGITDVRPEHSEGDHPVEQDDRPGAADHIMQIIVGDVKPGVVPTPTSTKGDKATPTGGYAEWAEKNSRSR
jgi:hypothetical protein